MTETPREISFCDHAIRQSGIMVVPDALLDRRFADNPLVTGEPGIRFYAGAPLTSPEGLKLGTLCVTDREPRRFSEQDCDMLASFAELVVHELNLRLALGAKYAEAARGREAIRRAAKLEAALGALLRNSADAIVASDAQGRIAAWNMRSRRPALGCSFGPIEPPVQIDRAMSPDQLAAGFRSMVHIAAARSRPIFIEAA